MKVYSEYKYLIIIKKTQKKTANVVIKYSIIFSGPDMLMYWIYVSFSLTCCFMVTIYVIYCCMIHNYNNDVFHFSHNALPTPYSQEVNMLCY